MKQGRMILWRLVLAAVTVTLCYGQVNKTEVACERSTLHLSCNDSKVIHIHDALYGRTSDKICGNTRPPESGCEADNSLSIVKEECENQTSCSVTATNAVFGDPCIRVGKYLEVTYSCVRICGINDECDNTTEVCHSDGGVDVLCNCGEDYEKVEGVCTAIPVPVPCPEDVVEIKGIILTFPRGKTGESMYSEELCPPGSAQPEEPLATRYCDDEWAEPVVTECYDDSALENQLEEIANTNVTEDNVEEVGELLLLASSQTDLITESGLENIITSLALIVEVGSPSTEVTDSVVGVVNNMMSINETLLGDSSDIDEVVPLLESQVRFVHDLNDNYTELVTNLGVSALQLPKTSLEDPFVFEDPFMDSDDDVIESRKSSITLPPSLLDIIGTVNPNLTSIPVSFITYGDAVLFQSDLEGSSVNQEGSSVLAEYVDGHVISATIEIENVTIDNLPENSSVMTRFSKPIVDEENNETDVTIEFVCVFWDYNLTNGEGKWSEEGCRMVSNDTEIVCACYHLTSFAVLVRISGDIADTPFHVALSIISIIGCIISIIALTFSLVTMLVIRSIRIKQQTHVHFNLCLALLGLYLSFLLGVDRTDIPGVCKAMTSLIYFFCLSSVAWMSVEAFYIYMLIWKYNKSSIHHLVTVAVFLAWGLPAIGAILIYFLDHGHDYEESTDYCFLHPGPVLYFGFLLEILLLSVYNFVIFVLATYRVSCRKIRQSNKVEKKKEIIIRIKSTFLFWVLLGMAWTFGFLATFQNPLSLAFQLLFCVCLSLQGFCMFYMLFAQNPEMKKSITSTVKRTNTTSYQVDSGVKTACSPNQSVDMHDIPVSSSSNDYSLVAPNTGEDNDGIVSE
ncbi:adhesion G-protein coupled receptor G2-like isoform X2 [Apostichopus japonicus]|uniref:adhesion G-protein coupled receptor G2-like isoform X2 n=1 Tax=Stichopus japonicus TaxID=307972 RepID=UPI003AB88000